MTTRSWTRIKCYRCDGHGLISSWSFGANEPDECPECGGAGTIVRYDESGRLASYPGGPFLGRDTERTAK